MFGGWSLGLEMEVVLHAQPEHREVRSSWQGSQSPFFFVGCTAQQEKGSAETSARGP